MRLLGWLVKISYKSREISVYTAATLSLPQPDNGVLRKAQRGDERAFSIIVRAYQIPVYNYVLRMVGDRSLAEDLTQEVFLRVFQGLPRFSHGSKFTTWLFQVTKNRVLDELRATERRPRAVVDLDDIPPLERPQLVEDAVLRHLEEPGREPAPERKVRQPLIDADEDFLRQILCERSVTDEPKHVVEDRKLIRTDDERESSLISSLGLPQDAEIRLGQRQVGGSIAPGL